MDQYITHAVLLARIASLHENDQNTIRISGLQVSVILIK